jgi:hypothetical protein
VAGAAGAEAIRFAHMNSPTHFANSWGEEMAPAVAGRCQQIAFVRALV